MDHSRRIIAHAHSDRSKGIRLMEVPWLAIVVLILALVVMLALWGKLPSRLRLPHQAPPGNSPVNSSLVSPTPLMAPPRPRLIAQRIQK
jgi:hypothetical protein